MQHRCSKLQTSSVLMFVVLTTCSEPPRLANAEKPVVARQLAGLLLKNALAAKDLTRDRELKQRWVSWQKRGSEASCIWLFFLVGDMYLDRWVGELFVDSFVGSGDWIEMCVSVWMYICIKHIFNYITWTSNRI